MSYLVDTHVFLWFLMGKGPEEKDKNRVSSKVEGSKKYKDVTDRLSLKAKMIMQDEATLKYISIASFWEISIKMGTKKLIIKWDFSELENLAELCNLEILPISFKDINRLQYLPPHHGDPFDRIIIAQSIESDLSIVTIDEKFKSYKEIKKIVW